MCCLVFVVVQALIRARGSSGALCSTVAASAALTGEKIQLELLRPLGNAGAQLFGR